MVLLPILLKAKPCQLSSSKIPSFLRRLLSTTSSYSSSSSSNPSPRPPFNPSITFFPLVQPSLGLGGAAELDLNPSQVASSFKEWFQHGSAPFSTLDRIYHILSTSPDEPSLDAALCSLDLRLDEAFVLQVFRHRPHPAAIIGVDATNRSTTKTKTLLLLRLNFFDWSARQHGYRHSRATYHAVFRLLSRARLMSVVLDWLRAFSSSTSSSSSPSSSGRQRLHPRPLLSHPRLHDTLVLGYAVAQRTDLALHHLSNMRFRGLDLDAFSYHVLLNSLVEAGDFDRADSILAHLSGRGLAGPVAACIQLKSLCRQGRLDDAHAHLRKLSSDTGSSNLTERAVATLVHALCARSRFDEAARLVDEFGAPHVYGVWVADLVRAGRPDTAMRFLRAKRISEDYAPDIFHLNGLICHLLAKNRLEDVYDLLVEMREEGIVPDRVTMNAALCFFCKAGMVDVAVQLYSSRLELGFSPNMLVYNCLICALCRQGNVDEVCRVLEESIEQGYFPGKHTFNLLANTLCREGMMDKLRQLLDAALTKGRQPASVALSKYVAALCKAGELEEALLVPKMVRKVGRYRHTYTSLIYGLIALKRADMLTEKIIEMQEDGHIPNQKLYRDVICCLCEFGNFDEVLQLLNKQLERNELDKCTCYNYFIDGAGHAKHPELATEVYNRMRDAGIEPNFDTKVLMLQSYLKSRKISDALSFFYLLCEKRKPGTKLYNIFISGLCEAGKADQAVVFWREMRNIGLIPSLQCYEELVLALCSSKDYDIVVKVLDDFEETNRQVSAFLCNVLLLHTLKSQELLRAWVQSRNGDLDANSEEVTGEASVSGRLMLGQLITAFSGGIRMKQNLENLDEMIEKFFPVDIFTYNMLLRGFSMAGRMDYACNLFQKICKKGFEPNRWSFDIIAHGFCKLGKRKEAEAWMQEMYQNGFHPTWYTMSLYSNTP